MIPAQLHIKIELDDFPLTKDQYELVGFYLKLSLQNNIITALEKSGCIPEDLDIKTSCSLKFPDFPPTMH